ncbi:NAD(P)H-dependent oxidoreductase [Brenneria populi subsp. brevivirga]|uniref:NAD(P)H-dependent oxidoreductase n=1 Tax=Brenneria populi TaxID=1505588 RepID=UPI002E175CEB|nr:NAD(P)H-dependent oxidoreductase [Brenneria populi subsp. brevivirga]
MHALIVVAHPDRSSFTHAVAGEVARGISLADTENSLEIADLAAEGFDPRFSAADLAFFRRQGPRSADVVAEQERIDRADALALIYPVYWWSFPALMKGWIDRVFTGGWAYEDTPDGKWRKKLDRLQVHLVGIGAANLRTYARHGYFAAMRTQIDHGIFDYVGARVVTSELLLIPDGRFPETHLDVARGIGRKIFA